KDGDNTIGALALYANAVESYSMDDLHFLESAAGLASTALRNAMLNARSRTNEEFDSLTGLLNNRGFYKRFEMDLKEAGAQSNPLSGAAIDLTGLREINDPHGYQTGDRMLGETASLLRRVFAEPAVVARIAGDEFICVINDYNRAQASALALKAASEVAQL